MYSFKFCVYSTYIEMKDQDSIDLVMEKLNKLTGKVFDNN